MNLVNIDRSMDVLVQDEVSVMVAALVVVVSVVFLAVPPLPQDKKYHIFADRRALCSCVPNTNDVLVGVAFLIKSEIDRAISPSALLASLVSLL